MPAIPAETLLAVWYRAQENEIGCEFKLADRKDLKRAMNMLYTARAEHGDPALDEIMLCLPGSGDKIFLVKKSVELRDVG